ncbi:MAG: type II toxin-antitoxin system prevent-host-death family antitoxin [Chloroflexi bacterium]|nr:type II toxin-antitoxin system prevent-host-death family antitoxin [Chloroflexota bacterium]
MYRVGARELKQHTGEIIARIQRGERVLLTFRGSPIAVISPVDQRRIEESVEQEARKAESLGWLALSESAFAFWDNEEDQVWDQVEVEPGR